MNNLHLENAQRIQQYSTFGMIAPHPDKYPSYNAYREAIIASGLLVQSSKVNFYWIKALRHDQHVFGLFLFNDEHQQGDIKSLLKKMSGNVNEHLYIYQRRQEPKAYLFRDGAPLISLDKNLEMFVEALIGDCSEVELQSPTIDNHWPAAE